jgi:hypothetical protein
VGLPAPMFPQKRTRDKEINEDSVVEVEPTIEETELADCRSRQKRRKLE